MDNYTISVTGPNMQELISIETSVTFTVVYNAVHTVMIRARNCAGSSGSITASIFEGKFHVQSTTHFYNGPNCSYLH